MGWVAARLATAWWDIAPRGRTRNGSGLRGVAGLVVTGRGGSGQDLVGGEGLRQMGARQSGEGFAKMKGAPVRGAMEGRGRA